MAKDPAEILAKSNLDGTKTICGATDHMVHCSWGTELVALPLEAACTSDEVGLQCNECRHR